MKRIDLNDICKYLGVRTLSYADHADTIRSAHLEQIASKNPFICCVSHGVPTIFFDGARSAFAVRFHVAAALGYFSLSYLNGPNVSKLTMRERLRADLFAARLLLRLARVNRHFSTGTIWAEKGHRSERRKISIAG